MLLDATDVLGGDSTLKVLSTKLAQVTLTISLYVGLAFSFNWILLARGFVLMGSSLVWPHGPVHHAPALVVLG